MSAAEQAIGVLRPAPVARLRKLLSEGSALSPEEWRRRHTGIIALLWLNVAAVAIFGIAYGRVGVARDLGSGVAVGVFALLGATPRVSRQLRTAFASLGLLSAAALLLYEAGGLLEIGFYFFVLIIVLTLYEDWMPLLLTIGFVLVQHGVVGMLDPQAVFDRAVEWAQPWTWAAIDAGFVAVGGIAARGAWRLNEDLRAKMAETADSLRRLAGENERLLAASREEANTDALTSLPNRRALMHDLERQLATASEQRPLILALFDLNGFKQYNDTFGHLAGDALLTRVGERLKCALEGSATAYRMGGDEFCVLAAADASGGAAIARRAASALSEKGEAFMIDSCYGLASLPREAASASEALRLADQRMYDLKAGSASATRQSTDVLLTVIGEHTPGLREHTTEIAQLSAALAQTLGLAAAEVKRIELAAELHDVGKVAIPETILNKPGQLNEEEWAFMRRHTEIAERIVSAAPSLAYAAELVRAHHERYDGSGYPDGLTGEEIPLGAAIIAVCDSFGAMTTQRPYSDAISVADALAELRRCSGTQFSPSVVEAFCELIRTPEPPSPENGASVHRAGEEQGGHGER